MNKINLEELKSLSLDELLERYSLEELEKLLPIDDILNKFPNVEEDPERVEPGVLLSDEIKRYVKDFKLICPFNPDNLKAASYYLTVGDEYALGGKKGKLYDKPDKNEIKIPPFQVAIIKTKEIINMPRFLIGRWNIRVTMAYEGLLWVGGPQVDPGWVGHLFCPIYNLSDEEVVLENGKSLLATIDFVRTTTFKKEKKNEIVTFRRDKKYKKTIDDYNWKLKSALFTEAAQRIDDVEKKVSRVESIIGIVLTIIVILFAVLSIFVTSSREVQVSLPIWLYLTFAFSIVAITISIYSLVKRSQKSRWYEIIVTLILSTIVIAITLYGAKFLWLK